MGKYEIAEESAHYTFPHFLQTLIHQGARFMFRTVQFFLNRLFATSLVILAVIAVCFLLTELAPGDPLSILVGDTGPSEEYIQDLKSRLGLDRPAYERFFIYVKGVAKGDLGNSLINYEPVWNLILSRLPKTFVLLTLALFWSSVAGILMGVLAATKRGSYIDTLATLVSVAGYSLPYFWLAMMCILIFSVFLGIFPLGGAETLGVDFSGLNFITDRIKYLFLPSLVLGMYYVAVISRLTRASMLEVLSLEYVMVARAKGLSEFKVVIKHGLRNALFPVVTIIGLNLGVALGGAVLTETVFSYPGVGRLMYEALLNRDYPVMLGVLIVVSIAIALANFITDLVYMILDPRVKYQ